MGAFLCPIKNPGPLMVIRGIYSLETNFAQRIKKRDTSEKD
jgi:hypothetical protein